VTKINTLDIEIFFKTIKNPASKARTFRQMKSCFMSLFKSRIIEHNPFDLIKTIAEPKSESYTPKKDDLFGFFNYLKDAYYEMYLFSKFLSLTGLRKGEALTLTWNDINNESIMINKAWDRNSSKVQSVKTITSNRTVPLFPEIDSLLNEIKSLSNNIEVFSFIYKNAISSRFRIHRNKYGLKKLTLHSLRHYFATECLEAGIEKKSFKSGLDTAITKQLRTYIHT
jgi:integrase